MTGVLARLGATALALACALPALAVPASAGPVEPSGRKPPPSTSAPQRDTARPASNPAQTCRIYGSSSGFGLLCSNAAGGKTLAQLFAGAGIDTDEEFCWDDPDLPDGFEPDKPRSGPGQWWLHTCLSFDRGVVSRLNTQLSYEYHFHEPGTEKRLNPAQEEVIRLVTGRGQIPFLQVQTSPVPSPRVGQRVAFSMLCDEKVLCENTGSGRRISTPKLAVGGVVMHAELVHLRVLPLGAATPAEDVVHCTGAGLPQTAEELDAGSADDPRVCGYQYERSSNDAGGGTAGDRYPARVTAYWQIYVEDRDGLRPFGATYEKTTTNQIRVTEVQTLVVS